MYRERELKQAEEEMRLAVKSAKPKTTLDKELSAWEKESRLVTQTAPKNKTAIASTSNKPVTKTTLASEPVKNRIDELAQLAIKKEGVYNTYKGPDVRVIKPETSTTYTGKISNSGSTSKPMDLDKAIKLVTNPLKPDLSELSSSVGEVRKRSADKKSFDEIVSQDYKLPTKDERAFAAGFLGDEAEKRGYTQAFSDLIWKSSYKPQKTQDQLFREGFFGDDTSTDIDREINKFYGWDGYTPNLKPNTDARYALPDFKDDKYDYLSEVFEKIPSVKKTSPKAYDKTASYETDFFKGIDIARKALDVADFANDIVEEVSEYADTVKDVPKKSIGTLKRVNALSNILDTFNLVKSIREHKQTGKSTSESIYRTIVNATGAGVFAGGCSVGGPGIGAFVGSFVGPGGSKFGGTVGKALSFLASFFYADDFGDVVERFIFDTDFESLIFE